MGLFAFFDMLFWGLGYAVLGPWICCFVSELRGQLFAAGAIIRMFVGY
ncbi:MAG: hypothetical protein RIS47_427 [Bacteroidota bacterium]|jgi:hypothetical protein